MTARGHYAASVAPIEMISVAGAMTARATCVSCGRVESWRLTVNRPGPDIVHKHFGRMGWQIRKRLTCPTCLTSAKARPRPATIIVTPAEEIVVIPPKPQHYIGSTTTPEPPLAPTDDAKAIRRKVYDRIDECYDENKKRYKPAMTGGRHTDRSIAEECGCADALVAKVREEFFGADTAISEPEQLRAIQDDLAYLQKEAAEIERVAVGLRAQAKSWQSMANEMQKKVDALCAEYGWTA